MEKKLRTFIAFPLNKETQDQLKHIQNEFASLDIAMKWVSPENIHLTLKFLGDTLPRQIPSIKAILDTLTKTLTPTSFNIDTLGAFPSIHKPKIFFAAINDPDQRITKIVKEIRQTLTPLRFPKEKRGFKAHLTLGRLKSLKNINLFIEKLNQYSLDSPITLNFDQITFYQSMLTPTGPIYDRLESFNLKKNGAF